MHNSEKISGKYVGTLNHFLKTVSEILHNTHTHTHTNELRDSPLRRLYKSCCQFHFRRLREASKTTRCK